MQALASRDQSEQAERHLPGDLAVWLIILLELATFGLLFATYAVVRGMDPELFNASQATLDRSKGLINTWLLIGGSWCVVRAVQAIGEGTRSAGVRWLLAAQACGLAFLVFKLQEYSAKFDAGIDLETNRFYMFYFILTGFHFFHVLAAMVFLSILTFFSWRGDYGPGRLHALETGAAFWHMVDLLWIVLFPLLYLAH